MALQFFNSAAFAGIVTTDKIFVAKGQNVAHVASSIIISQESTAKSQIRFYGADTSTAGILEFTGSSSDGSVGGVRLTLNADGSSTFTGTVNSGSITSTGQIFCSTDTTTPTNGQAVFYKASEGAVVSGYQVILESGSAASRATALTISDSQNASFTGNATIETGINLESGTLVIKNATGDSSGLKIFQDTSDVSKIHNNYSGTLQLGVNNSTLVTIDSTTVGIEKDDASPVLLVKAASQTSSLTPTASLFLSPGSFSANATAPRIIGYRTANFASAAARSAGLIFGVSQNNNAKEAMRITEAQDVGIGTTLPSAKLTIDVKGGSSAPTSFTTANSYIQLGTTSYNTEGAVYAIGLGYTGGATNSPAYIGLKQTLTGSYTKGDLVFLTRDSTDDIAPTEKMRILSNGDVCIGTTSPSSNNNYGTGDLNVENDVFASAQVFTHNSTAGNYSFFGLGKSSGTGASPTIVQAQETVGEIRYYGYDGNDYRALAVISADVDGTPGDDDMPGRIEFGTTADGAIAPTTRMVIGQQGVVTVGASKRYVDSASTQFDLEVTEGMAFGGAAFTYATIQGDSAGLGNIEICANAYPANTGAESKITFKTSTTSGGQYTNVLVVKGPYVGIGTDSPDAQLHINAPTGNVSLILSHTQNVQNSFIDFNGNSGGTQARIAYSDALGDISISPNFSTGPSMTLRNNNRVGIGITNPTRQLSVISRIACVVSGTTANAAILFGDDDDDSVGQVRYNNSDDSMELRTDSTERIRIDSSGDVTIQTSGADDIKNFTINSSNGSSNVAGLIIQNDGANGYINFKLGSGNAAPATKLTIGNAANFGNVGFGVTSPNALLSTANSNSYTQEWTFAKGYRHFTTYPAGSTGNYNISTKISFNNLRGITVDYYESGHLFNNGAAVYFRHTRFYIMMEGSTLRINDAVLIRSTGNRTDAIVNAPAVTTNASLECLITSTIKSGFTHYVAADIVGTGFNRIVSIS